MKKKTRAGMRKGRGNAAVESRKREAKGERQRGRGEGGGRGRRGETTGQTQPVCISTTLCRKDSHEEDRQHKRRRDGKFKKKVKICP